MPGRSLPSSGSFLSISILTGMRWTILVKLPVALSGGSSANSWPLAGREAVDMAVHLGAREGVDIDRHRLAGPHIGELRLLVIRDDIDRLQRHHRHQLRAGLDVLADPQSANADCAIDRRRDRRVAEVEFRLVLHRLLLGECRVGLGELCPENADLLLGGGDNRDVVPQCGLFFAECRPALAVTSARCRSRSLASWV